MTRQHWNFIIYLLFATSLVFCSCKKYPIIPLKIHGHVIHTYTKSEVAGITFELWDIRGSSSFSFNFSFIQSKMKGTSKSDNSGNLEIKARSIDKKKGYTLRTKTLDYSSMFMDWTKEFTLKELEQQLIIELKPSGWIKIWFDFKKLSNPKFDTLIVQSPYVTDTLIRNKKNSVDFYVDPIQASQFSWYYLKNREASSVISKSINVPNFHTSGTFEYELTF